MQKSVFLPAVAHAAPVRPSAVEEQQAEQPLEPLEDPAAPQSELDEMAWCLLRSKLTAMRSHSPSFGAHLAK
ncbi:hypothetical protein AGR6A_pTi0170 [Agrobacterium sp. NCPPB 925]|nr:hypothetical protein AGR6A_pTi0170 [Agrobacterium sp. NCPPB 925]